MSFTMLAKVVINPTPTSDYAKEISKPIMVKDLPKLIRLLLIKTKTHKDS